ncbi:DUF3612 domain-containing protein [Halioxenophilus sp. WMMB6]|uniref:DUF3612 domain-containing protein n=1 Tax=Halioxenophilus sp. WMMB6 TaxID=3073815 RepID=UPI00295EDBAB|nr:DUF3612 domain-containing protein [Halioxenophilus sp. WMMB6]
MKNVSNLLRKSHFLGTKIRNLRKNNHLTMEDLSSRCVKINAEMAPSVSYLSMIERGKRVPSEGMLEVIAEVFQKDLSWFLDDSPADEELTPVKNNRGGISGMALEPSFLFSKDILQIALPEMLAQTGTSGRQFAQLLIRAYQEYHRNHFPDLERAAEEVGQKRMPLDEHDLIAIAGRMGLEIHWFDAVPEEIADETGVRSQTLVRSYFEPPNKICLNERLKSQPDRLKYDLAVHLGHCTLHDKDGVKSLLLTGRSQGITLNQGEVGVAYSSEVNPLDILQAWRDFECSFFAGALLCPKVPFRQLLDRMAYSVDVHKIIGVTPAVAMRRMTAVSSYPHWHYFDAYAPGTLKAVYRGNGIPLPWGNMRLVADACQHWAVFRMINTDAEHDCAQISVMEGAGGPRIYACQSRKVQDLADNDHVLTVGIDLNPALDAQHQNGHELAAVLREACVQGGGEAAIPKSISRDLLRTAKILNIGWVESGLGGEARLICSRGAVCPRTPKCYG